MSVRTYLMVHGISVEQLKKLAPGLEYVRDAGSYLYGELHVENLNITFFTDEGDTEKTKKEEE